MANIKQLVENKTRLDYPALCKALIEQFGINEPVNWDSILPAPQQQELFGGEVLRFVETHPQLASQKDIRPITLKKGSTSQMLFFFVCLADSSLPKKQIEQITKRFIKGTDANRYIIWFFGNKGATELKVVLSAREGKKIVLKTLPFGIEQPYYKTYDYLLREISDKVSGKLFVEPTELWKALWKAFDISIVNKKFYEEVKRAFDSLLEELNKKGNPFQSEEDQVQFAIRLIGRIIFCWFLKRKQILKEEVLSSGAVSNQDQKDYYHDLLEVLFFEVMNKPEKERPAGLPKLIAKYPFLNGGLFDAQDTDFYANGPDYRIRIDNTWFYAFFNNTLEKYNFTVDENSSSSAEIAIDPEMLGRIFENLLAEQNPETGESARKATGSYYTPREIVDYMVEQSIAEYLKSYLGNYTDLKVDIKKDLFGAIPNQQLTLPKGEKLKLPAKWEEYIEDFVHTNHLPDELKSIATDLSGALNEIKVLDPACGSGAFPIGVLQKIIGLKQEILQTQNPKKQFTDADFYKLKLSTIQNSIYGVDIQPMAVELSRLRCWLSLVVDEEINNIKSLPNLDFKFVCADSLVDVPENEYVRNQSEKSLKEFAAAVEKYFNPDYKKKSELKDTIKRYLNEITDAHDKAIYQIITQLRKERNSATTSRLKQLEKSLQDYTKQQSIWHSYRNIFENKKVEFFKVEYFFPSVKNGFDIVIANPPYRQLSKDPNVPEDYKAQIKDQYKTSGGRLNTFIFFIHRGINLLKDEAVLTYIIPNTILTQEYYAFTRQEILQENRLEKIISYVDMPFENAVVENVTLIVRRSKAQDYPINIYHDDLSKIELVSTKRKLNFISQSNFAFNINTNEIIESVFSKQYRTLDYFCEVNQAIALKGDKSLSLKKTNPNGKYYRLLDGRNINRYSIDWNGVYLDYDLDRIHSCKRKDIFLSNEKLMFRRVSETLIFTYDNEQYFALNTIVVVNRKPDASIHLKYLLAILNSTFLNYIYRGKFKSTKKVFSEIQARSIEQLPIKEAQNQLIFSVLVDYVLTIKRQNDSLNNFVPNEHISKQFEELIDACVYELYFENEVKAKEADVLQLVAEQFKPIAELSEPEKIKVIQKGYQLLRDSHNEIRNRITRQKLVAEIAIIQNSVEL